MIRLTLAEVAAATSGRLAGGAAPDTVVTGSVVIDSRAVDPGALFVALPGERADGHDFAAAAVSAGAIAVIAAREVDGVQVVVVADPLIALGQLARAVCDRLPGLTVVGVTGSSGKTSTKDLLGGLLAALGPTVAPRNSFNNEIGVPLTALRCTETTRYLICEMGARVPGNITYLCQITPPDVAVVLNVGSAHLGVFGSREVTAQTKGELVAALGPGGVAVLNADDPFVRAMAARTAGRVVFTSQDVGRPLEPPADTGWQVRADDVRLDGQARASFTLRASVGASVGAGAAAAPVALRLHGAHHVANALAAAAVALELGLPLPRVAELLCTATAASPWRMAVQERGDGVTVVNDAYNANPDSVQAALQALAAMGRAEPGASPRRTWAVLGEMLELGDGAAAEHERLGRSAVRLGVSRLVAVGPGARPFLRGAADEASAGPPSGGPPSGGPPPDRTTTDCVDDADAALHLLRAELAPGDIVLVKASRGIGLDRLAGALLADHPVAPATGGVVQPAPGGELTA